jgi:two-component system, OmpR family, sensor histidine kinase BaeS
MSPTSCARRWRSYRASSPRWRTASGRSAPRRWPRCRPRRGALGKLVDDLYQLALSDLGALNYRRQDLDLRAQVAETLLPLHERCAAAGLVLDDSRVRGDALPVHADPDRLAQLVANLVENALRYTDAPGRIEVSCGRRAERALLDVRDTAPGVPEDMLPRLFERFFRVEASRSRASGAPGSDWPSAATSSRRTMARSTAQPSPLGGLSITVSLPLRRGQA